MEPQMWSFFAISNWCGLNWRFQSALLTVLVREIVKEGEKKEDLLPNKSMHIDL